MSNLIEEIRNMTPAERAELAGVLKNLEPKPQPVVKQLGQSWDMRPRDERGRLLSEEEIYDQEHPLNLLPYGFTETSTNVMTGKVSKKVWTKEEVDAHNFPIAEAWLIEKRKFFPHAQLPSTGQL